jgi:hypothetical protein
LQVGSLNQTMTFLFDTGSCWMWVNLPNCEGCVG